MDVKKLIGIPLNFAKSRLPIGKKEDNAEQPKDEVNFEGIIDPNEASTTGINQDGEEVTILNPPPRQINIFEQLDDTLENLRITGNNIKSIREDIKWAFGAKYNNIESKEKRGQAISKSIKEFIDNVCLGLQNQDQDVDFNSIRNINNRNTFIVSIFKALRDIIANRDEINYEINYENIFEYAKFLIKTFKESDMEQMSEAIRSYIVCPNRENKDLEILLKNKSIKMIPILIDGYTFIIKQSYQPNNNTTNPERHYIRFIKNIYTAVGDDKVVDFINKAKIVYSFDFKSYEKFIEESLSEFNQYKQYKGDYLKESINDRLKLFDDMYDRIAQTLPMEEQNSSTNRITFSKPVIYGTGAAVAVLTLMSTAYRKGQIDVQSSVEPNPTVYTVSETDETNIQGPDVYYEAETTADIAFGIEQLGIGEKVIVKASPRGVEEILYAGNDGTQHSVTTNIEEYVQYLDIYGQTAEIYEQCMQDQLSIIKPGIYKIHINYTGKNEEIFEKGTLVQGRMVLTQDRKMLRLMDGSEIPFDFLEDLSPRTGNYFAMNRFVKDKMTFIAREDMVVTSLDSDTPIGIILKGANFGMLQKGSFVGIFDEDGILMGKPENLWNLEEEFSNYTQLTLDLINRRIDEQIPSRDSQYYNIKIIPEGENSTLSELPKTLGFANTSTVSMPNTISPDTELVCLDVNLKKDKEYSIQRLEEVAKRTKCPIYIRVSGTQPNAFSSFLRLVEESEVASQAVVGVEIKQPGKKYDPDSAEYEKNVRRIGKTIETILGMNLGCVVEAGADANIDITKVLAPEQEGVYIRTIASFDENSGEIHGADEYIEKLTELGYKVVGIVDPTKNMGTATGEEINGAYRKATYNEYMVVGPTIYVDTQSDEIDDEEEEKSRAQATQVTPSGVDTEWEQE